MWQHRSSPLREAESGAMGHVAALEPTSVARRGPELKNAWRRQSSTQHGDEARGHGPHGSIGANLCKEVRSGATGHVAAPKPTSTGRCGLKLQLTWQRVESRPAPFLDLELICGGTRSSGYRQSPRPHLGRGCEPVGGANFLAPRSVIMIFLLGSRRRAPRR
jgi:hypothetical protein